MCRLLLWEGRDVSLVKGGGGGRGERDEGGTNEAFWALERQFRGLCS